MFVYVSLQPQLRLHPHPRPHLSLHTYALIFPTSQARMPTFCTYAHSRAPLDVYTTQGKRVLADVETFNTMLEACGKRGWSTSTGDGLRVGAQVGVYV